MAANRDLKISGNALSTRKKTQSGNGCVYVFLSLFVVVGVVVFGFIFVKPVMKILDARSWVAVPCTVTASRVESHRSDDGTTYSVHIEYRYDLGGVTYNGDRYSFSVGSSSGFSGKQAVVDRHPPGAKTVCYVNPANPADAVLNRGFTTEIWFGLFPLIFVVVGLGGMVLVRNQARKNVRLGTEESSVNRFSSRVTPAESDYFSSALSDLGGGPVTLKATTSPVGRFLLSLFVAVIWNGIISVFLVIGFDDAKNGMGGWFILAFMIPFVLVGLVLIWMVGYTFLGIFSPKPTLHLNSGVMRLGDRLEITWQFSGQASSIERLHIFLQGEELSIYRRGTSTATDRSTFAELPIVDTTNKADIQNGRGSIEIPLDTMHSWDVGGNKIVWTIRVHGDIRRWPDVYETFPFLILPKEYTA